MERMRSCSVGRHKRPVGPWKRRTFCHVLPDSSAYGAGHPRLRHSRMGHDEAAGRTRAGSAAGISLARRDGQGTARLLLDALRARMKAPRKWHDENGKEVGDLAITLVGHSMGTMILNNVLEDYTDLSFDRIVYLAAAASIDDVRGAVLPY